MLVLDAEATYARVPATRSSAPAPAAQPSTGTGRMPLPGLRARARRARALSPATIDRYSREPPTTEPSRFDPNDAAGAADEERRQGIDPLTMKVVAKHAPAGQTLLQIAPLPMASEDINHYGLRTERKASGRFIGTLAPARAAE